MNIHKIIFKGYGKAQQRVCDNCPLAQWHDWADSFCGMGLWRRGFDQRMGEGIYDGVANIETGEVVIGKDEGCDRKEGWIGRIFARRYVLINMGSNYERY